MLHNMIAFYILLFWALCAPVLSIQVTESSSSYVVNVESSNGMTATISRKSCDITSLKFRGTEYQYSSSYSQIASGLGTATVSYTTSGDYVVVQCVVNDDEFDLTQYMVFKNGDNSIYMGTYTVSEPSIGELRYIFRLSGLTKAYPTYEWADVSDISDGSEIEASDVYMVGDETRSKYYSSERFIDDKVYCATNDAADVHACFVRPNSRATEKSSGGPFFRDINLNNVNSYHSVTYYMNSNHAQTEAYRQGFHGPYVFTFTRTGIPDPESFDTSFFADLDLTGYVGESERGYVQGKASGVSTSLPTVLHWYNDEYQAWAYAADDGSFTSPALVAGTYTMRLYQDEFLAATSTVSVAAGSTKTANIAADSEVLTATSRTTVFRLGEYDGRPAGFRNAAEQLRMHPSDARMAPWSPGPVASDDAASLPMALFKAVNGGQVVSLSLDADLAEPATLRVATTLSFAGGRPGLAVNGFECPTPSSPSVVDSRGVTRGAYRGRGEIYECTVPSGTLKSGDNTITIEVVSGSSGEEFLSPNFVLDAIELFY